MLKPRIQEYVSRLSHGAQIEVNTSDLLPAAYHFNPTLILSGPECLMMYRRVNEINKTGIRAIALCRLGETLQPEAGSNVDIDSQIDVPVNANGTRWLADPRFFEKDNEIWFSFHDNSVLYTCPLPLGASGAPLRPVRPRMVDVPERAKERNWGFFQSGQMKAVYSLSPFKILKFETGDTEWLGKTMHEQIANLEWRRRRLGEPHGGSMPQRIGNRWFGFMQSAELRGFRKTRHYHVGFYSFEAEEPHRLLSMSRVPVISGDDFPGERSFWKRWSVTYPSGAVHLDGKWLVSLGIHDKRSVLAVFDHNRLLAESEHFA